MYTSCSGARQRWQTPEFTDQEKSILALLDANVNDTSNILASLEKKSQYNFTLISTMAAVIVLVNIEIYKLGKLDGDMKCTLIVFGILYLVIALCSILTLWPRVIGIRPIDPTWETASNFRRYDWSNFRNQLILHYVNIHEENENVINDKHRAVLVSYLCVGASVLAILVEAAMFLW